MFPKLYIFFAILVDISEAQGVGSCIDTPVTSRRRAYVGRVCPVGGWLGLDPVSKRKMYVNVFTAPDPLCCVKIGILLPGPPVKVIINQAFLIKIKRKTN